MHNSEFEEKLLEKFKKLCKNDSFQYDKVIRKIEQILNTEDLNHYKNLRKPLQHLKRVHIGHFILTFTFTKSTNTIKFIDYDHHDRIYR